jgi:Cu-Zn family superoxide dismutase
MTQFTRQRTIFTLRISAFSASLGKKSYFDGGLGLLANCEFFSNICNNLSFERREKMKRLFVFLFGILFSAGFLSAAEQAVTINLVSADGVGKEIGKIVVVDTQYGLLLKPDLSGLPPGLHGFHVHEKPSCEPSKKDDQMTAALGAGGHYDPDKTTRHEGPYASGHRGDLPALHVGSDGKATTPVLAPRLKLDMVKGTALMIHAGGDNYSDQPEPLGGGGARIACGVIR